MASSDRSPSAASAASASPAPPTELAAEATPAAESALATESALAACALRRARGAYERSHVASALRGGILAGALTMLAFGLHRMSDASWLAAAVLAGALAALGWRGGAWRRGAVAGVVAGLPPLIAPSLVFAMSHGWHCAMCDQGATLPCLITCFVTGSLVGILAGHRAVTDLSPRRFALAAVATAALTGLLGCGTTGLGGAVGIVVGLVAGGVTGWIVAARTAHA